MVPASQKWAKTDRRWAGELEHDATPTETRTWQTVEAMLLSVPFYPAVND